MQNMASQSSYVRTTEMQKRLEELHQRFMVSSQEPQQDAASTPAEPTLLGIPHELRSNILELAVYHELTDGLIAPLPDDRSKYCVAMVRVAHKAAPAADTSSLSLRPAWYSDVLRQVHMRAFHGQR